MHVVIPNAYERLQEKNHHIMRCIGKKLEPVKLEQLEWDDNDNSNETCQTQTLLCYVCVCELVASVFAHMILS